MEICGFFFFGKAFPIIYVFAGIIKRESKLLTIILSVNSKTEFEYVSCMQKNNEYGAIFGFKNTFSM